MYYSRRKEFLFYCMLSTIFLFFFLSSFPPPPPPLEQFFRDFPTVANHFDTRERLAGKGGGGRAGDGLEKSKSPLSATLY